MVDLVKPSVPRKSITYWKYKSMDKAAFRNDRAYCIVGAGHNIRYCCGQPGNFLPMMLSAPRQPRLMVKQTTALHCLRTRVAFISFHGHLRSVMPKNCIVGCIKINDLAFYVIPNEATEPERKGMWHVGPTNMYRPRSEYHYVCSSHLISGRSDYMHILGILWMSGNNTPVEPHFLIDMGQFLLLMYTDQFLLLIYIDQFRLLIYIDQFLLLIYMDQFILLIYKDQFLLLIYMDQFILLIYKDQFLLLIYCTWISVSF